MAIFPTRSPPQIELFDFDAGGLGDAGTIMGIGQAGTTPGNLAENTFAFRDTVSWVHGVHAFKFGVDITREQNNDDEPGLHLDYEKWLEDLAPHEPVSQYRHNQTGEDNADAHLKRQVMGREVVVVITAGQLDFGPWEQIFYGEFDGRRRKRALVKIIAE